MDIRTPNKNKTKQNKNNPLKTHQPKPATKNDFLVIYKNEMEKVMQ